VAWTVLGASSVIGYFVVKSIVFRFIGRGGGSLRHVEWLEVVPAGIIIGLILGAIWVAPLRKTHKLWTFNSLEAVDLSVRITTVWLAMLCLPCALLLWLRLRSPSWPSSSEFVIVGVFLGVVITIAVLAAVGAVVSHIRTGKRRAWLQRVREGKEPGWKIEPQAGDSRELSRLRPLLHGTSLPENVLWRCETVEVGAYRTNETYQAWALV
jgi:hypothetical protein